MATHLDRAGFSLDAQVFGALGVFEVFDPADPDRFLEDFINLTLGARRHHDFDLPGKLVRRPEDIGIDGALVRVGKIDQAPFFSLRHGPAQLQKLNIATRFDPRHGILLFVSFPDEFRMASQMLPCPALACDRGKVIIPLREPSNFS